MDYAVEHHGAGGSVFDGIASPAPSIWSVCLPITAALVIAVAVVWISGLLTRRWMDANPAAHPRPADPAVEPTGTSTTARIPTAVAFALAGGGFLVLAALMTACGDAGIDWFAIRVQRWFGLLQIPTAPLMHLDFVHLAADVPLLASGILASAHLRTLRPMLLATAAATVLIGLMHWVGLDTTQDVACGSSGLGYMLFAMAVVVTVRRPTWWAITLLTAFLVYNENYQNIPGCMIPLRIVVEQHVGWAAHLVGFTIGVIAGLTAELRHRRQRHPVHATS